MSRTPSDPELMEPVGERWPRLAAALFAAIALLVGADLVADAGGGVDVGHVAAELAAAVLAAFGASWLWRTARRTTAALRRDLATTRARAEGLAAEAARWRAEAGEAIAGVAAAIDRQLERWQLTAAEREVALLLLKGLSLKEIAAVRETSERTARQQALAVYRKAGLAGRAELAAFFLEDLLAPRADVRLRGDDQDVPR